MVDGLLQQARLADARLAGQEQQGRAVPRQVTLQRGQRAGAAHQGDEGGGRGGERDEGGGRRLKRLATPGHGRRQGEEAGLLLSGEVKRVNQAARRVTRGPVVAALQVLDVAHAQPGALGQRLLRQPRP